jgi:hypothetical protein
MLLLHGHQVSWVSKAMVFVRMMVSGKIKTIIFMQ